MSCRHSGHAGAKPMSEVRVGEEIMGYDHSSKTAVYTVLACRSGSIPGKHLATLWGQFKVMAKPFSCFESFP
eukprot:5511845-Amphidinium_carterae.1